MRRIVQVGVFEVRRQVVLEWNDLVAKIDERQKEVVVPQVDARHRLMIGRIEDAQAHAFVNQKQPQPYCCRSASSFDACLTRPRVCASSGISENSCRVKSANASRT